MIQIVTAENRAAFAEPMEQAYRLRHAVFVEEMKWEVLHNPGGRELGRFDDGDHASMLASDRRQKKIINA